MSNSVSRFPESNAHAVSPASDSPEKSPENLTADGFIRLVVDNETDRTKVASGPVSLNALQSSLDRVARERVFAAIVQKTLDNPQHPYYSLVSPETRRDMIQRITADLCNSHYLIPNRRTS